MNNIDEIKSMKKLEYFVNWLLYVSYCFDRIATNILYYILIKPLDFFFVMFVPKRFHPLGMKHPEYKEKWYAPYTPSSRIKDYIILMNIIMIAFIVLCAINVIIRLSITTMLIISFVIALPCLLLSEKLTLNDDKYLFYFRMFEKKSRKWKITSLILGILALIESFAAFFIVFYVADYYVVHFGYPK